ncbi:MAG: DUF2382 domain-containing protein [Cytophagales bacterium]|nr:MAG: DUF2382 domain-containing protein [Cytophagales bacterium]
MAQTVIGIFDDASEAQTAVQELMEAGFSRNSIDLSTQSGSDMTNTNSSSYVGTDREEKGGISGFFASLFGDDDDDDNRRRRDNFTTVGERHSIVTVHAMDSDEAERAADIMDDAGAIDVDERAQQYSTGSYAAGSSVMNAGVSPDPLAPAYGATAGVTGYTDTDVTNRDYNTTTGDTAKIDVIEENLSVGKRVEERGGVRLRSRIIERPVEESVRLREERVTLQRNPVNRPATDADFTAFKEGQVEMVEHVEVPVVAKEARVVEEISLGKEVSEREETIRDTVRRTDVEVENLGTTTTGTTGYNTTVDPERDVTNR